jgi:hypothetical protein
LELFKNAFFKNALFKNLSKYINTVRYIQELETEKKELLFILEQKEDIISNLQYEVDKLRTIFDMTTNTIFARDIDGVYEISNKKHLSIF